MKIIKYFEYTKWNLRSKCFVGLGDNCELYRQYAKSSNDLTDRWVSLIDLEYLLDIGLAIDFVEQFKSVYKMRAFW